MAAFAFTAILVRLFLGPDGWFSIINGADGAPFAPLNLSGLALADPLICYVSFGAGLVAGFATFVWANTGNNARLFPVWVGGLTTGLVAAAMSAPIAAGVFGGVTGSGQDLLVSLYRTLGLSVFQSAFAQGLTSDPFDKTISYTSSTSSWLPADHRPHDLQRAEKRPSPKRGRLAAEPAPRP